MTTRIQQGSPMIDPLRMPVSAPPQQAGPSDAVAQPRVVGDQTAFPHLCGSGLTSVPLVPGSDKPPRSDAQVLNAAAERDGLRTPRVGCFNPGTPVTVTKTDTGFRIEIGGFRPRTVEVGRLALATGRLSPEQQEAIALVRTALDNTPKFPNATGPIVPHRVPIRQPGQGPEFNPFGREERTAPVKPTDRTDLDAAVGRGTMGSAGGCTNPGPGEFTVTRTSTGYNIQITTGGVARITRDVSVSLADLESGKLTPSQRRALDRLHELLNGRSRPPVPPISQQPRSPRLDPRPLPPLTWPRPVERPSGGEKVTVTDVDARIRDLEAGLRKGTLGTTGCTSLEGALEITRTADGFKLTSLSGGFLTHRREVEIKLEDLRRGTLTNDQLEALEDLRRRLSGRELAPEAGTNTRPAGPSQFDLYRLRVAANSQ